MEPFQLLLKPAAGDCNLACGYCFYRGVTPELYPEARRPRMELATMRAVVADLLSYRFPETVFCWQGGEPTLMGLDFFEAAAAAEMEHGRPGQVVGNALQTNGVLIDRDWARFLARCQVVVGLSLDGPRELHDHYRRNLAGAGSFERVLAAVELVREYGVAFNILAVVNRLTQERPDDILRFFRSRGFEYVQFIPCLERDPQTGAITEFSATPDGLGRFYRRVLAEYPGPHGPTFSERTLDALLNLQLGRPSGLCTLDRECGRYLVIEHNGDVYPCDFFVRQGYCLGNVRDRRLASFLDDPRRRRFAAGKARLATECGGCRWLPLCHGGCQKDRLPDQDAAPGRTHFCAAYRELFAAGAEPMDRLARLLPNTAPALHPAAPPGRNDPCPCGSGKKFKRCCGR